MIIIDFNQANDNLFMELDSWIEYFVLAIRELLKRGYRYISIQERK